MRLDRLCLLSIDPARSSGWAVSTVPSCDSGCAKTSAHRDDAVAAWLHLALRKRPCAGRGSRGLVQGREESRNDAYSMGVSFGFKRWAEAVEATGIREDWILRVKPSDWRKALQFRSRGRQAAKAESVRYVHSLHGLTVGDDEADAICPDTRPCAVPNGLVPCYLHRSGSC